MITWLDLESRFRNIESELQNSRLDGQGGAAGEHWYLAGSFSLSASSQFKALARLGGEKLISDSAKSLLRYPEVSSEADPIHRWYKALQIIGDQWRPRLVGHQSGPDGQSLGAISMGSIDQPASASATLCLEISAKFGECESTPAAETEEEESRPASKRLIKWVAGILGALVLTVAGSWAVSVMGPSPRPVKANLKLEFTRFLGDYQLEVTSLGNGGMVYSYWEATISNKGTMAESIVKYELSVFNELGQGSWHTSLDQGLFDQNMSPLLLPLVIEPGHAARFFVKTGIILDQGVYDRLIESYSSGEIVSIESACRMLYRSGIDLHGLSVESAREGTYTFPNSKHAPAIGITFQDTGGESLIEVAGWYPSAF